MRPFVRVGLAQTVFLPGKPWGNKTHCDGFICASGKTTAFCCAVT